MTGGLPGPGTGLGRGLTFLLRDLDPGLVDPSGQDAERRAWRQVWQAAIVSRAKRPGRQRLAIHGYPMWLVAAIAVALLVLPWMIALALVRHHHLDATAVAILASVSIPLSALWLAWVTLAKSGGSGSPVSGLSMAQVADQLAVAVGTQWKDEADKRRLNDPYPLPVSWAAADVFLTDAWDSLVRLATGGAGRPAHPTVQTWAAGPEGLAGEGGELVEVLARVPTGRLVVLGEPGAGKTMLMVRLVLDLLARRADGDPVPFLASVASWDPVGQDLRDWLAARLLIDHPALASPPPVGMTGSTQAAALLAAGLILPVLDGLDEIPEQVRGPAISRINDALRLDEQVVVTCRSQQYRDAIRPEGGVEATLRGAAAVQLHPLDAEAVRGYLCDDAAGPVMRARWAPVLAVLGTAAPAGQALRTPLMVGLARAIYNPRPGELAGTLRDPVELCDQVDQEAVEFLLFDAFIPAAYRHDPAGRWKAQDAKRWLVFLARHLDRTIGGPDLAWWQLRQAVPRTTFRLVSGLGCDLDCLRRAGAGAVGVGAGPVPADDLGAGMCLQPFRQRVGFPVPQQVHGLAGVHVDQHGAVVATAAEREVVDLLRHRSKWTYPDLGIIPTAGAAMWWMPWWRAGS